ncbi:MAG: nuclear transport factor 2 family protein [Gemmatimonadota bacterium]|nr:nuclear transport factor 2 family protein [Gemmatimonadota bacterium]
MSTHIRTGFITLFVLVTACSEGPRESPGADTGSNTGANAGAGSGIDSLNTRLVEAYRRRDPAAYGALYTDTAVFEWPAFNTVRGPAGLEAMVRTNWISLKDMDLHLSVASRRIAENHATEFGAFQQSWSDSTGARMTEFGRYVTILARGADGSWKIDRFLGFADSTRSVTQARP